MRILFYQHLSAAPTIVGVSALIRMSLRSNDDSYHLAYQQFQNTKFTVVVNKMILRIEIGYNYSLGNDKQ
ncbi:MAG: hypothetical protein Q8N22_00160 [bacterium]|nr:hypothetical protein [bacterium]